MWYTRELIANLHAQDIDCMPLNPNENMPALLRRNGHAVDKLYENFNEHKVNEQANDSVKYASRDNLENGDGFPCLPSSTYAKNNLLMQTEVSSILFSLQ